MFDVDGTLVLSDEFDGDFFVDAIWEVLGQRLDTDWTRYTHVSDAGILDQHICENGLLSQRDEISANVKKVFIKKIEKYLRENSVQQVPGASSFLSVLRRKENIVLSIATGGWYETALMKLESAKIDISGIPVASSNDHFSRTSIMKIAEEKAIGNNTTPIPCTYFGDGEWDREACKELGYNFVLVGNRANHNQNILDYRSEKEVFAYIGL